MAGVQQKSKNAITLRGSAEIIAEFLGKILFQIHTKVLGIDLG